MVAILDSSHLKRKPWKNKDPVFLQHFPSAYAWTCSRVRTNEFLLLISSIRTKSLKWKSWVKIYTFPRATFNASSPKAEAGDLWEFQASQGYKMRSWSQKWGGGINTLCQMMNQKDCTLSSKHFCPHVISHLVIWQAQHCILSQSNFINEVLWLLVFFYLFVSVSRHPTMCT